jgi:hypothetical protein
MHPEGAVEPFCVPSDTDHANMSAVADRLTERMELRLTPELRATLEQIAERDLATASATA